MEYSELLKKGVFEARQYQLNIADIAKEKNTLVVLPTGMGKTLIAVLVAITRLQRYPGSKALVTSPTRPLNAQHKKSFEKFTNIEQERIVLITGKIKPEDRTQLYKDAKVIVATPQCIENDLQNERLNLADFSHITFDEAHRSVGDYAYTFIAKKYMEQAYHPLILGLTASPGGSYEKIDEIRKNLFIEAVEIRVEADEDVEKYVKPIEREWVYIDFPEEFQKVKLLLEEKLKADIFWLRDHHLLQTLKPSKKSLLMMQKKISAIYGANRKNYAYFWVLMKVIESIKLEHAIELLETQSISSLREYMKKISESSKKSDKQLVKDEKVQAAIKLVEEIYASGKEHPKFEKTAEMVRNLISDNTGLKIIIFANYRATVEKIRNILRGKGVSAEEFIGQAVKNGKGLSQERQIETLKRFRDGAFNVLVATSIGEEGLDVPAVDYAIFYEPVPSEIRMIQRRGRVGRQTAGKIVFLITKNTRDEAYYWAAFHKEKKMRSILYDMKERGVRKIRKKGLRDWVK